MVIALPDHLNSGFEHKSLNSLHANLVVARSNGVVNRIEDSESFHLNSGFEYESLNSLRARL